MVPSNLTHDLEVKGMQPDPPKEPKHNLLGVWLESLLGVVKNTFNPKHHYVQFKEDFSAFKHAIRSSKQDLHEHDMTKLVDLFRGRFVIAMFVSGPFNMVAVVLVQALSYLVNNPYVALILPFFSFFLTGTVFQLTWWWVNQSLYRHTYSTALQRFRAFEHDLWPVHMASVQFTLVFWTLNLVISGPIIGLLDLKNTAAAHHIPWVVVLTTFEFIIVSGPFVRNMGDFFERYSKLLAQRYSSVFEACALDQSSD